MSRELAPIPTLENQEKPKAISMEMIHPGLVSIGFSEEFKNTLNGLTVEYLVSLAESFKFALKDIDVLIDVSINEAEETVEVRPYNNVAQITPEMMTVIERELKNANEMTGME